MVQEQIDTKQGTFIFSIALLLPDHGLRNPRFQQLLHMQIGLLSKRKTVEIQYVG